MNSVENKNVRTKNPFFTSTLILALAALLLSSGCRTKDVASEPVGAPPTAILPPAAPASTTVLTPPPAQPDFRLEPIPSSFPKNEPSALTYKVKSGDSLSLIAAKYGVSAREIAELNGISNPNKIKVGQKLSLPAYAKERHYTPKKSTAKKTTTTTVKKSATAAKPVVAAGGEYVVKSGDSIGKIALQHHVQQKDLLAVNSLTSDKLKIGQKLKIPGAGDVAPAAPVEATPAAAPASTDPLAAPAPMPAVDPLAAPVAVPTPVAVPGAAPVAPAASVQTFEVSVDPGDTVDSISQKYGVLPADIKKLNNITEVAPGQRIKLPLPTP